MFHQKIRRQRNKQDTKESLFIFVNLFSSCDGVTHILKPTPVSTTDGDALNLIRSSLSLCRNPVNLVAGPLLEQRTANDEDMKEIFIVVVTVTKPIANHHMPE